ncbi:MAG: hypothetical protein P0Y65_13965 [Candidatus Devosia phytovorans]|uniref:Uncharacterized protein n=1 Tax=Candidatus Devosia phytovorans TaxID=3121372 RepID=A0AAJ6AZP1_9HYPH|nr:hypothetical protein [Devosia sp.]WEK03294.1 MAG: hypothetical protein P0Y65_13965 [Devosia sp.]
MTLEDFQDALDTHGCKLSNWPAAEARAGSALLEQSRQAQVLLAEAERLDGALSGLLAEPVKAPDRLRSALLASLPDETRTADVLQFPRPQPAPVVMAPVRRSWSRPAAYAAAAMVVCFVGGICTQAVFSSPHDVESTYIAAVYGDLAY